jgi:hypothetical protein
MGWYAPAMPAGFPAQGKIWPDRRPVHCRICTFGATPKASLKLIYRGRLILKAAWFYKTLQTPTINRQT